MLVVVGPVELAPVQTSVIDAVAVPALKYVDLAVGGPLEGVFGQHPVCWPDTFRHGWENCCCEVAARSR